MKIVTDSAADLPKEEVLDYNIHVAPLTIHFPDGQVTSEEISADQFYDRLRKMAPEVPTTSQPASGFFTQLYQSLGADEEILSVHISSGLSGTAEAARLGAKAAQGSDVTIIDTMTLSGGERFQVIAAALADRAGWSRERILARLENIRGDTEVVFTLETLEYLARGGRIGRVQALAGSLLNIKPVIHVAKADGKYSTVGRGRTLSRAINAIADHLEKVYSDREPLWVSIMHGQLPEQAEALGQRLKEKLEIARLEVLRISPVLGVHTGPGVVGAAVVPMRWMQDLI